MRFTLSPKLISRLGTGSLQGLLLQEDGTIPQEIILEFSQSTPGWRHENKGPMEYIVVEYNIPCLIDSILALIKQGKEISVETTENLDKEE